MNTANLTPAEGIEVLANTRLSDEQEELLERFGFRTEKEKKKARLAYYFQADEGKYSKKYFQPKKQVELTQEGADNKLLEGEKKFVRKFGLSENAVRNVFSQLQASPKSVEVLASNAARADSKLKWDNIKQRYVKKEKEIEKPKSNVIEVR